MKKFKGMSPATVKRLIRLVQETDVKWTKNRMNQMEASCGSKFGTLWLSLDLDDFKTGWVFISDGTVVTKKCKTKPAAKRAAERWLKGKP